MTRLRANHERRVGQPLSHRSAVPQVTGEAKYTDDISSPPGTLHAAFVLSSEAHANILSIDPAKALAMEGVVRFFSSKDLSQEENKLAPYCTMSSCFDLRK